MSGGTPTLIPRVPHFPSLLPRPPHPHPLPIARRRTPYTTLGQTRDLQREMDDLSDEEEELEQLNVALHNRGWTYMIPIGKTMTLQEERNDAAEEEDDGEDSDSQDGSGDDDGDGGRGTNAGEETAAEEDEEEAEETGLEDESGQDLDASIADMDQDASEGFNEFADSEDIIDPDNSDILM